MVLQQIFTAKNHSSIKNLYIRGKVYELLSLHFDNQENTNNEYCPFLIDDQNVLKIRKAKDIIIAKMSEPPSLQELANEVGLNSKKLKDGFKQIYGDTVYSFLLDYKMEYARKLLEGNQYNVLHLNNTLKINSKSRIKNNETTKSLRYRKPSKNFSYYYCM
jgi:AraC-like DNA-binding protein